MANFAQPPAPVAAAPSLPRIRLAIYATAALVAVALWLVPSWLSKPEQPDTTAAAGIPGVNAAALDTLSSDLKAWRQLLSDPRLDQLQAPAELRPGQPGNPSPFVREVAPTP
jgi:hypothetical protein